jgi:hypothetical protein
MTLLLTVLAWWVGGSLIGALLWILLHWNRPIVIEDWTEEGRGAPFR